MIRVMIHEVRHAYQWEMRHGSASSANNVPDSVLDEWRQTYIPPRRPDWWPEDEEWLHTFEDYYLQPVEVDANAFAGLARLRESGGQR